MPTTTFAVAAATDDGAGFREDANWANITAGAFTAEDDTVLYAAKYRTILGGGTYVVENAFMRFDTSSLPDGATVTAANLLVYLAEIQDSADDVEYAADFYDFGGEPSVAADWEQSSSGNAIALIDPDSLVLSTVNTIALTGLSGISLSGFTGIRIAPNSTDEPTSGDDNWIGIAAFENANQEPRLEVTYTEAAGGDTRETYVRHSRGTSW